MPQPRVIVVGGGLAGLAAAHELERLKLAYTLIEVKGRLGGSIISRQQDGFVLDGGAMAFPRAADWSFLADIGLSDEALFTFSGGRRAAFRDGTQTVIDALARPLTGEILRRMAVSSVGRAENHFALCLENGLLLDARAVIVAAPARYAGHLFRTLQPQVSLRLLDYGYDTITRVSLGCRREDIDKLGRRLWDMGLPFYYEVEHPSRVPPGGALVHVGVRFPLPRATPDEIIAALRTQFGWSRPPLTSWVTYWPEADPLPPHMRGFRRDMAALMRLLPEGVALAGSDYNGLGLAERIAGGRQAARRAAAWLET